MTHINFDDVARRDAKEPQITKTQLLELPHHASSGTGWDTPRSNHRVGDLVDNGASWNFGPLDTTETPSDSFKAPVKQEPATPAPNLAQYESGDEDNGLAAGKQGGNPRGTAGRRVSGSSSEDKFGHKSGVIDLTGEDSDDDKQDLAMPERQFVPRAELDSAASSFSRQRTSSPPRTFTKGLAPVAAHPRKPPIVHRSKPPIKPAGRQRKTTSASPSPAVAASQTVFTKRRRLLSTQPVNLHNLAATPDRSSSATPSREVNPTEEMDTIQGTTPAASAPNNPSGPFLEEDDSSDDAGEKAAPPKKTYSRDSVTRLLDRPRNDTPIRPSAPEEDAIEDAMQDVPMQSIEFPSDTDGAFSPPVRSSYNESTSDILKGKFSVQEGWAAQAGPAKRQQTITAYHQATKSGNNQHHANSAKSLDMLLQKGRDTRNIHSSGVRPAGETTLKGHQSDLQRQLEARSKASAAAQDRQRAAAREEQKAAQRLLSDKAKTAAVRQKLDDHRAEQAAWDDRASAASQPSTTRAALLANHHGAVDDRDRIDPASQTREDNRAEQDAWRDRASVTARTPASGPAGLASLPSTAADREHLAAGTRRLGVRHAEQQDAFIDRAAAARNLSSRPTGHSSLPNPAHTRPRPTAATRPFPRSHAPKQPLSVLDQISADAKRARERKRREAEARKEHIRASSDDTIDSQAQREAEENHAISKTPPYQPLRTPNTVPETGHAPGRPRPYEPTRITNTIPELNDDARTHADSDDELVLEPSPPPPQGPFSLNSAAGVRAVQKSIRRPPPMNLPFDDDDLPTKTTTQRFMGTSTPKTKLSLKKPSRHQDLLPITASDLKLYQWREQKINWAEVRQRYSDYTNTPLKSEDTLRARFRQISKVVEIGVVTDEMCERVINGDEVATAELNRIAGKYADVPGSGSAANPAGLEAVPFRKIVKQTPAPRGVTVPPPAAPPVARPTQGGKLLDHDTYLIYLNYRTDARATDDDSDTDSRAGSPPAPEDCVHWEYYIERRNLYSEDLDADFEELDETALWCELNASFGHAGHANAEACKFIFTVPEGSPAILRPEEEYKLTFQPLEDGMSFWALQTAYGMVQVRVCRRMWSFQDHVMPETKEGWVPKTVYGVFVQKTQRRKRTVKRVVKRMEKKMVKKMVKQMKKKATPASVTASDKDSLFGDEGEEAEEAHEENEEEQEEVEVEEEVDEWHVDVNLQHVDDAVYGSLDQANQVAIKEWVRLTMKPSSANLDEFACRCAEARKDLQRKLRDEAKDAVFKMVMEDDEKTVEVFAKNMKMRGPRN